MTVNQRNGLIALGVLLAAMAGIVLAVFVISEIRERREPKEPEPQWVMIDAKGDVPTWAEETLGLIYDKCRAQPEGTTCFQVEVQGKPESGGDAGLTPMRFNQQEKAVILAQGRERFLERREALKEDRRIRGEQQLAADVIAKEKREWEERNQAAFEWGRERYGEQMADVLLHPWNYGLRYNPQTKQLEPINKK
ncbi:MAG: hypothetical protein ABFE07_28855 [Armatimonadia bacterium]